MVVAHIDKFGSFLYNTEGGLACLLWFAHESDDSAVGGLAGIHVKEFYTFYFFNLGCHLVNDIHVASLADIGNALDKLFHDVYCV